MTHSLSFDFTDLSKWEVPYRQPIPIPTKNGYILYMFISMTDMDDRIYFGGDILSKKYVKTEEFLNKGIAIYRDSILSTQVRRDLVSGKCEKILLDYSAEGVNYIDWEYAAALFGIQLHQLIWHTSIWNPNVMNSESEVEVKYNNFWEAFLYGVISRDILVRDLLDPTDSPASQQIKDIENLVTRPFKGLCYNRQPHPHRLFILAKMKHVDLLRDTYWSWGFPIESSLSPNHTPEDLEDRIGCFEKLAIDKGFITVDEIPSLKFMGLHKEKSDSFENLTFNKADNLNFLHVADTYFQIITETFVENNSPNPYLSEKSYKPFACCQPFVIWGQQNNVKALREMGYDVYDKWIDHSYDEIENPGERLHCLMEEIKRLYAITPEEFSIMLKEMLPTIKKNFKHLSGCINRVPNDTLARQDIMDQRKESIERENYAGERGIMIDKDKVKVSISLNFEFIDQEDDK